MNKHLTPQSNSWVEIDRNALLHNIAFLMKQGSNRKKKAILMLKANAYGHGLTEVAAAVKDANISMFAVTSIEDAIKLRDTGATIPILITGSTPEHDIRFFQPLNITATIDSFAALEHLVRNRIVCNFHIKIDCGLHRYGFSPTDIPELVQWLRRYHLRPEGIYTHYGDANTNPVRTAEELAAFQMAVETFLAEGFRFDYIHASNSAGALWLNESFTNAVRIGLAGYGLQPNVEKPVNLIPCLTWRTRIDALRFIQKGETAGYGHVWRAKRDSRLAILPTGYSDGLRSRPKRQQNVLCEGSFITIVGNIMMNHTIVDVTDFPEITIGSIVTIIGRDGEATISLEDIADQTGTINEEIVTQIQASIERRLLK